MQKVLTAAEMREVDRQTAEKYGIPFILLMENAAHAAANIIREKFGGLVADKSFFILCGKGNNGGDGAALARILWTQGADVSVYLFGEVDDIKGEAQINFKILKNLDNSEIPLEDLYDSSQRRLFLKEDARSDEIHFTGVDGDIIIDAIFGTGLSRAVINEERFVIEHFYKHKNDFISSQIIALDVPSGVNSDSGQPFDTIFPADLTITFTAPKPANVLSPAASFNGELVTVNIGSPQELIDNSPSQLFLAEKSDAQNWLRETKFTVDSYKKTRGHALVIAGSKNMSGAAVLCANAAMTSGVGLVTVATPEAAQNAIASRVLPEVMVAATSETERGAVAESALEAVLELNAKMDAAIIGCGLSSNEETTRNFVRRFIENRKTPIVIDADGLNALAPFNLQGSDQLPLILTPHIGEMRRLLGIKDDEDFDLSDRVKIAREFAQKHRVILVLKGERTLIAAPDGKVIVNPTGNAGLGKAGNGDTLAGVIAGFVTQTLAVNKEKTFATPSGENVIDPVFDAVVAALYIAGLAGDFAAQKFGMRTMTATNVRECLNQAFQELKND